MLLPRHILHMVETLFWHPPRILSVIFLKILQRLRFKNWKKGGGERLKSLEDSGEKSAIFFMCFLRKCSNESEKCVLLVEWPKKSLENFKNVLFGQIIQYRSHFESSHSSFYQKSRFLPKWALKVPSWVQRVLRVQSVKVITHFTNQRLTSTIKFDIHKFYYPDSRKKIENTILKTRIFPTIVENLNKRNTSMNSTR